MLLVSLVGDAKIVVPDSLLDVKKSYLFFITSPDTAHAIINTLRERKAVPEWRLDLAEGDMYDNARRYLTALTYYNKVDGREEISDSIHIQRNTTVNIGTLKEVYVVKDIAVGASVTGYYTNNNGTYSAATGTAQAGTTYYEKKDVLGADIRDNVYGGGNDAVVTGNAEVVIGKKKTE